jgi:putative ABC transport system permease protein
MRGGSVRWVKVFRDLWLHKARTTLVVLAIAVGLVGAGVVLNAWALVRRVTREQFLASDPASATLRTDSVDALLLASVRALPGIREVQARRTTIANARGQGGWSTAMLYTLDDFSAVRIGLLRPEAGRWPPPDGALVIERSSLAFSGAAVGESIGILLGDGDPLELPVVGIARDVGLAPGWMEHVVYGFVTRATLQRLGAPSALNELQIVVDDLSLDRQGVRRLAHQVKAMVENAGHPVVDVEVPEPGQHVHAGQMNSLLYTQGAFGALALALAGFLVVNLIAAMLAGQVREIGVLKAIGAEPGQIGRMYLALALLLGVAATGLALPVAMALGYRYAELKAELLNFDLTGYAIPAGAIVLQVGVGWLMPVAAAAIPVVRGCRIPVSEALRDVGLRHKGPAHGVVTRVSGVARPLLLSLRNAFRRRQRMALTLLALGTGGGVYLGALNLRASVKGAVDLLYRPLQYEFTVRLVRSWPADSLEARLNAVPGVRRAEAWSGGRAALIHPDGTLGNGFGITALPLDSRLIAPRAKSGRWLAAGDSGAVVVSESLLRDEPTIRVGNDVSLMVGGAPTRWRVVGVVDAGPSPSAFAPRETVSGLVANGLVDRAVVAGSGGSPTSQLELIQRVRGELERSGVQVQSTQLLAEGRRVMEDHLLMVVDFLGVMAWLMIVVGGLGLWSTMSLAVLERTREIGVLRAIGARHRAILTMVQAEGLVIGLLSWAIALPLSVPMSLALGQAFGRIMIPVPADVAPEPSGALRWLVLVVVVSLVASAWPAFRATRVPTAVALAYE